MDIQKVAEIVLSLYNSEKKAGHYAKTLFRDIVSGQFRSVGHLTGLTSSEFFAIVAKKCHEIQPPAYSCKHKLSDKEALAKELQRNLEEEYKNLGNGDPVLGKEFLEHYLFD